MRANSIGYHVPSACMKMYIWGSMITGKVAFVSQSGGCGQEFINQCTTRGIGISKIISFGNALTLVPLIIWNTWLRIRRPK